MLPARDSSLQHRLPHVATSLPDVSVNVFKSALIHYFFPLLLCGGTSGRSWGRGKNVIEIYCVKFLEIQVNHEAVNPIETWYLGMT